MCVNHLENFYLFPYVYILIGNNACFFNLNLYLCLLIWNCIWMCEWFFAISICLFIVMKMCNLYWLFKICMVSFLKWFSQCLFVHVCILIWNWIMYVFLFESVCCMFAYLNDITFFFVWNCMLTWTYKFEYVYLIYPYLSFIFY